MSEEKTDRPNSPDEDIVFLGMYILSAQMRFTVSEEHREYVVDRIATLLHEKSVTKKELVSVTGF